MSTGGGTEPRWRRDGKELFYVAPSGTLMAVDVSLTPTLKIGARRELIQKRPLSDLGVLRGQDLRILRGYSLGTRSVLLIIALPLAT